MCLQVPDNATGQRARCPACQTSFVLPDSDELMEHTLASWIESDVEQEESVRSAHFQQALAPRINVPMSATDLPPKRHVNFVRKSAAFKPPSKPLEEEPRELGDLVPCDDEHDAASTVAAVASPPAGATSRGVTEEKSAPVQDIESGGDRFNGDRSNGVALNKPAMDDAPAAETRSAPSDALPPASAADSAITTTSAIASALASAPPPTQNPLQEVKFQLPATVPAQLHITGPIPHLVVTECNQAGVHLSFDAIWLDHMGFRCSMPVRGVFGNNPDLTQLRARPLAFIDRSGGTMRDPQEFEARYEQPLMPGWTARDLITNMGIIKGLPTPLNRPMPYYVDSHHTNLSLTCTTERRSDGGLTCHVRIPNGGYALDWLARVNGVCGPEYQQLKFDLMALGSDAWAKLSESCRQRLSVWTRFRPRERFLAYLSDADFGSHDAGLAGLVLTDQRIVYHKYHHNGEVELSTSGQLRFRPVDDFMQLTFQDTHGDRVKLVRLHVMDADMLKVQIAGLSSQVQIVEG